MKRRKETARRVAGNERYLVKPESGIASTAGYQSRGVHSRRVYREMRKLAIPDAHVTNRLVHSKPLEMVRHSSDR